MSYYSLRPLGLIFALVVILCGNSKAEPASQNTRSKGTAATTLDRTIVLDDGKPYKRLKFGPSWKQVLRQDLAVAQEGREERREALLSIAHISDVHLADSESPLRMEYMRELRGFRLPATEFQAAWRPHETLLTHVAEAMIQQLNAIRVGPITGRPYDFAISTGDNSDNRHLNELERFITILDGGTLQPSSGDPKLYEGVQDSTHFDPQYWHPDPGPDDQYKTKYGFPDYPGLLEAAVAPFQATGVKVPWYSAYGNHDFLIQGNFIEKDDIAPLKAMESIATGSQKMLALPKPYSKLGEVGVDVFLVEWLDPIDVTETWKTFVSRLLAAPSRTVTADPKRHIVSRQEYVQAHLDSPAKPGPPGHGFTKDNITNDTLYYSFEPVPGILGITLDTVSPAGESAGSLDRDQVAWIEARLQEVHSQYYDEDGNLVKTGNEDKLVVLFSHHHLATLTNILPDPAKPFEGRVRSDAFKKILHRYPNMVVWLNGHSHFCRVFAQQDFSGRTGGFWEVNTPSHADFPQQSRIVELVDNKDGTLSIFATLVDHAAPPETGPVTKDILRLAAINRELSANDPQVNLKVQLGTSADRNVELIVRAPFERE